MRTAVSAAVLGFVALCVLADVRTRRVPNPLSLLGTLVGLGLHLHYAGAAGLAVSATGLALAVTVLVAPFAAGGVGGGDVKMMGALGAMLGPWQVAIGLGIGLVLGGIIAAACAARHGKLRATAAAVLGRGEGSGITLPYSVPLGIGAVLALLGG